jgi:hypothetical protein
LTTYLRTTVAGCGATSLPKAFEAYLAERAADRAYVMNPYEHVRAYCSTSGYGLCSDNALLNDPMHRLDVRDAVRVRQLCTAYTNAVQRPRTATPRASRSRSGSRSGSRSDHKAPSARTAMARTAMVRTAMVRTAMVRTAVFHAKLERLLRCDLDRARTLYARSPRFRAHLCGCKSYCYTRFLYKVHTVRREGGYGVSDKWTDAQRDALTYVAKGEASHLCVRCGEQVCRQEGGLTVEYDVMGMSSTHSEKRTDVQQNPDGTDHGVGEHVVTGAEVPVDELLARRRVTKFEAKLDAVEMTTAATHLAKHLGYTGKPKLPVGCTLGEAKRHLGRSCTEAVVALYDCAVDALLRAMDKRGALTTPAPPIRLTKYERAAVSSFQSQLEFAPEELKSGIAPRPFFRPRLTHRVKGHGGAKGWQRVDQVTNHIGTDGDHAVLDASSLDTDPTVYLQRDQYVCAPQSLGTSNENGAVAYTSIAQLMDPGVAPKQVLGDTSVTPNRLQVVRVHPYTRLSSQMGPTSHRALPTYATTTVVRTPTAGTRPCLPLAPTHPPCRSDVDRRARIASYVRHGDLGAYPYPVQALIDAGVVNASDKVSILQWLIGVNTKVQFRVSTYPRTAFGRPAWVEYYEQIEPDNQGVVAFTDHVCASVAARYTKNRLAAVYAKTFA